MSDEKHTYPLPECVERFSSIREIQLKTSLNVEHIKERIDNGMSKTITQMATDFTALKPIIEHHSRIVRKVEDIGWAISRWAIIAVLTTLLALVVRAASKGWKP